MRLRCPFRNGVMEDPRAKRAGQGDLPVKLSPSSAPELHPLSCLPGPAPISFHICVQYVCAHTFSRGGGGGRVHCFSRLSSESGSGNVATRTGEGGCHPLIFQGIFTKGFLCARGRLRGRAHSGEQRP